MSGSTTGESVASIVLSTVVATSSVFAAVHGYPVWVSLALTVVAVISLLWALSAFRRSS